MTIRNYNEFKKWCENNGFRPEGFLSEAERWAMECDGSYGGRSFEVETGRRERTGRVETVRFNLVEPSVWTVENEDGETVGTWAGGTEWTYGDGYCVGVEVSEPVYEFWC